MNLMEEETPRLTPDDVETLFHEAGHGFHCLMGMDEVPGVNGTNTGWDYVELPSQFMESFAFKRTLLDTYAFHYQTGAVIPQETLDQILKAKTFDAAYMGARQTMFGIVDLAIHTTAPEEIDDLKTFEDKALEGYRIGKPNTLPSLYNSFTHIAGGYAAGYYVYKWADAIVANARDPFERREAQTGEIFPPDLCKAFAEHMIKPGGKIPSAQMLANFKQAAGCNDTSLDPLALFRAEGIAVPAEIETKILRQQANPKP
jgi:peptidyl-dipeptidase Dcp